MEDDVAAAMIDMPKKSPLAGAASAHDRGLTDAVAANDPALRAYLLATDDAGARRALERLTRQRVSPTVLGALRGRGAGTDSESLEDIRAHAVLDVVERLIGMRRQSGIPPIHDLDAYIRTVASNARARGVDSRSRLWRAARNRLRYLLTPARGYDTWKDGEQVMMAGFVDWRDLRMTNRSVSTLQRIQDSPFAWIERLDMPSEDIPAMLAEFFREVGSPVPLSSLTTIFGQLWGMTIQPLISLDSAHGDEGDDGEVILQLPAAADLAGSLEARLFLKAVWSEIEQLPVPQRAALLLSRGETSELITLAGVATFRQIANALGLSPTELAELWSELPLDDLSIARRLGVTRREVINLRLSARRRLRRRTEGWGNDGERPLARQPR